MSTEHKYFKNEDGKIECKNCGLLQSTIEANNLKLCVCAGLDNYNKKHKKD
jgi:hypothetical protein